MGIRLNVVTLETFKFPGGEVHVKISQNVHNHIIMTAILKNSDDIMQMLLTADAIKREGGFVHTLVIPYVPYARQDRVCNRGEAFSLKVMCDLINSIQAKEVIIYDPHSDVTAALINNCKVYDLPYLEIKSILKDKLLICPDAGAEKRILKLKTPYVMATKVRDVETGEIKSTKVYAKEEEIAGRVCIIVDDICDGGRTFIELAKVLRELGAASVELYVTHGIFSKGFDVFKGLIDKVHYFYHTDEAHSVFKTVEIK